MHSISRLGLIALTAIVAVGCSTPAASGEPSSTPASSQPASTPPAASGSPGGSVATAEPLPSDDEEEPFTCDLPIHSDATVPRANITDVRIGEHDGYDRVVFEFGDGLPEASLERAEPPFVQDASGLPLEVDGSSFLRLVLRGGTKQQDDGTSSYDGSTDIAAGMPTLVHVVEGGDFEAQSTWYLGLASEACVRFFTLTDDGGARLVIDVEH